MTDLETRPPGTEPIAEEAGGRARSPSSRASISRPTASATA